MEWVGDLGWPPRGPPVRHASNHFSLFVEVKTTKSHPQGRSSFPEGSVRGERRPSRPTRLGSAFVPSAPSSVVCTVKLRGPCCTNFMRGQQKQKRVFAKSSVKNCGCVKNNATHVPFAARSRLLAPWPTWTLVPSVTRFLPQRDTLPPRCLSWRQCSCLRFAGLGTDDNIVCSVVCNSFRPLVVESGDEPEANLWHRILARRCHRSIGEKFAVRDGEPSTTGVATSATSSTLVSFTEPAFFGLLLLRVHGDTQCVSVHPETARLDSCFRCYNQGTVRSRS